MSLQEHEKWLLSICFALFVEYFTDRSKAVLLLWIFYVFVLSCVCYVLCASVYMCFVVTCWERADLLALVCGVFCEFVTFPLVSWVRCGTWLYRFLIFAPLLTFICREQCIKIISSRKKCGLFSSVFKKIIPNNTTPTFQEVGGVT